MVKDVGRRVVYDRVYACRRSGKLQVQGFGCCPNIRNMAIKEAKKQQT